MRPTNHLRLGDTGLLCWRLTGWLIRHLPLSPSLADASLPLHTLSAGRSVAVGCFSTSSITAFSYVCNVDMVTWVHRRKEESELTDTETM